MGELDGRQLEQERAEYIALMMPQVLADMLVFRVQVGQVRGSSLRLLALSSRRFRGATAAGNVGFPGRRVQIEPPFYLLAAGPAVDTPQQEMGLLPRDPLGPWSIHRR